MVYPSGRAQLCNRGKRTQLRLSHVFCNRICLLPAHSIGSAFSAGGIADLRSEEMGHSAKSSLTRIVDITFREGYDSSCTEQRLGARPLATRGEMKRGPVSALFSESQVSLALSRSLKK